MLKPQWYKKLDEDWFLFPLQQDRLAIESYTEDFEPIYSVKDAVTRYIKLFKRKLFFFFEKVDYLIIEASKEDGTLIIADEIVVADNEEVKKYLDEIGYPYLDILTFRIKEAKKEYFNKYANGLKEELIKMQEQINFNIDKFVKEIDKAKDSTVGTMEYKFSLLDIHFNLDNICEINYKKFKKMKKEIKNNANKGIR